MLFCAVFRRISARFCGIRTPLTPPSCCLELFLKHGFLTGRKKLKNILDLSFLEVPENFHI